MKTPVDHILRPRLPWRSPSEQAITECGYDASKVKTLTREQYAARLLEYGKQRSAMVTCMTCSQTYERHPTWEEDPRLAVSREVQWEVQWWTAVQGSRETNGCRLKDELLALASLAAAHPEEFAAAIAELQARRDWLERKNRSERPQ